MFLTESEIKDFVDELFEFLKKKMKLQNKSNDYIILNDKARISLYRSKKTKIKTFRINLTINGKLKWAFTLGNLYITDGKITCNLNKPSDKNNINIKVYKQFGILESNNYLFCKECSEKEFKVRYLELLQSILERHSEKYRKILKKYKNDVDYFALEGNIKLYTHLRVERNKKIVSLKKEDVLAKTGKLECEACGFDFSEIYNGILKGEHFCEVHHRRPLGLRKKKIKTVTEISSLAILCSNCHRMIHKTRSLTEMNQILTVEKFNELLTNSNFMKN